MPAGDIEYRIEGDASWLFTIVLDPGEAAQAKVGAMVMPGSRHRNLDGDAGSIMGILFRRFSRETFFMPFFINTADDVRTVSFASAILARSRRSTFPRKGGYFFASATLIYLEPKVVGSASR
jgi:uncharacterized protein (AIM24 family)